MSGITTLLSKIICEGQIQWVTLQQGSDRVILEHRSPGPLKSMERYLMVSAQKWCHFQEEHIC